MSCPFSDIGPILQELIEAQFRIDEWTINNPANIEAQAAPPSSALIIPTKLDSDRPREVGRNFELRVKPKYEYQVMFRLISALEYHQLPHAELEALCLSAQALIALEIRCRLLTAIQADPIVQISYQWYRAENKDWLAIIKISISLDLMLDGADVRFESTYFSPAV